MNILGTGTPRTEFKLDDKSITTIAGLKGITAVAGITERGVLGTPRVIRSWVEYTRYYGGLMTDSLFPLYCKRALDRGATLEISRVAHYADLADPTTVVGDKAVVALANGGATVNAKAKSIGAWGNNLKVTIVAAANAVAGECDISVELDGYPELSQILTNVTIAATPAQLTILNKKSTLVEFDTLVTGFPIVAETVLAGGTEDYSGLVDADYIGTAASELGFHAFDGSKLPTKICIPEVYTTAVEVALSDYVKSRGDMIAILRTPSNITGLEAEQFRNKTGAYAGGTVIDNAFCRLIYGDITVINPLDDTETDIHVIGDILGVFASRDNNFKEWFAAAGNKRGRLFNNLGVVYNVGVPARRDEANAMDRNGVEPVIDHESFGTVFWGNSTLQKKSTLLSHANVAELIVYLNRTIKPLAQESLFDPNDIATWKDIYRRVDALMAFIKAERGVFDYAYQGDQDIDDVSEAQINDSNSIALGVYKFNLFVQPTPALKYVGVTVTVTNTGVSLAVINEQPTVQ